MFKALFYNFVVYTLIEIKYLWNLEALRSVVLNRTFFLMTFLLNCLLHTTFRKQKKRTTFLIFLLKYDWNSKIKVLRQDRKLAAKWFHTEKQITFFSLS